MADFIIDALFVLFLVGLSIVPLGFLFALLRGDIDLRD